MLGDLENKSDWKSFNLESVLNWWKVTFELDVNDGTNDLRNFPNRGSCSAEASYLIKKVVRIAFVANRKWQESVVKHRHLLWLTSTHIQFGPKLEVSRHKNESSVL
jgi:hypothetical protein